jgi:4-amino-4-deoxy-L-arabinose transferase-like glycosyltransferase
VLRTPGYPGLLALTGPGSPLTVIVLQSLLAASAVLLAYLIALRLFGYRAALIAAGLLALDAASTGSAHFLMSETAFSFLTVLGIWLLVQGRTRLLSYGLAGLALALAALVRPLGYYLVPVLALVAPLSRLGTDGWRRTLARAFVFLLAPVVLLGAWQLRNRHSVGSARFSAQDAFNLYFYRAAGTLAIDQHRDLYDVQQDLGLDNSSGEYSRWLDRNPGVNAGRIPDRWTSEAVRVIQRRPGPFLLLTLRSAFALFFEPGSFELAELLGRTSPNDAAQLLTTLQLRPVGVLPLLFRRPALLILTALALLHLIVLYSGVVIGLVRRRFRAAGMVVAAAAIAYFVLASSGPEARARFRVPLAPLLAALSGAGWASMVCGRRHAPPAGTNPRPDPA